MSISSYNFNRHPELSDEDFVKGLGSVFNGGPLTAKSVSDALTFMAQNPTDPRYLLYQSWVGLAATTPGYVSNPDDAWLQIVPTYGWYIAAAVGGAIAVFGALFAVYKVFKKNGNGGESAGEY